MEEVGSIIEGIKAKLIPEENKPAALKPLEGAKKRVEDKTITGNFDKAKGRGRPVGSTNTTAEQEISSEILTDILEDVKKQTTGDPRATISPKLKSAFDKSFKKTMDKHKLELFENRPEIVLIGVSIYMFIDAIGKEAILAFFKGLVDKGLELCNKKTV